MEQQDINDLITTTRTLLGLILAHPEYQSLDYYPDLTIADAKAALDELLHEINGRQTSSFIDAPVFPFESNAFIECSKDSVTLKDTELKGFSLGK